MHELGLNYRITDFQCALGLSQLNKIKKILNYRKKVAKIYDKNFRKTLIFFSAKKIRNLSSNHLYVLNIDFKKIKISRNALMKKLLKMGITIRYIIFQYLSIHTMINLKSNCLI